MGHLKDTWDNLLFVYTGQRPRREAPPYTPPPSPPPYRAGTGDGTVRLPGRNLSSNEFRKLLEAFMRENGYLPRDPYEFERWLNS